MTARDKFGNQKAISSDMYFGRNAYDPNAITEAQSRLQNFQSATSISSNQYFGREEEEELVGPSLGQEGGSLAQFELVARDAVAKVLANPDVQNVGESIRTGALKVSMMSSVCKTL
jgi:ADP-ribosylation factor GTPase-activating protein 2/3